MNRSHVIRLYPTAKQAEHFRRTCGCVRVAYNWGIDEAKRMYEAGEKFSHYEIKKRFNTVKKEKFPWIYEVTKWGPERAFDNLGKAYSRFFQKKAKYPRYKRRGVRDSYYVSGSVLKLQGRRIQLPRIGFIRMAESLRFEGKLLSATVKLVAGNWYVSIAVECEDPIPPPRENQTVGVDLGIKHFAVLSTGEKVEGPKALEVGLKKLRRLQRQVSRKKKCSVNRRKAVLKLARQHFRVRNIRQDFLHKFSARLVSEFNTVVIEDLAVKNMIRNHTLARRIADAAWGEFRRQLEYKAPSANCRILVADRFFASSKTCSNCGFKLDRLDLSVREWTCPSCGRVHDRDHNAATNLKSLAAG